MAGKSFDPKLTVVVSNIPADVGEDELTIHFRQERNGGGDVDDVLDESGSVAFVIFHLAEVASSVVNHEQIIHGTKVQVESYQLWLTNKKKQEGSVDIKEESYLANEVFTVYVSGFEDSTTDDAIMCFFENKRRSGGGELREDDYKRISPTIACLTFVDSKDAENVLKKANETPLQFLDGNVLKVSVVLEPTHDRSILLANNLNPKTSEETFRNFTETKMHADVLNVVLGRNGKAIVILRNELEKDSLNENNSSEDMSLDGFIISLEFAPVTKGITIRNIPSGTSHDDIKFKFSNPMKGGGKVTDLTLDKKNGSANIYFVECSVVSRLVKMEHRFKGDLLTVFPYYDEFEVTEEGKTKTAEYSSNYSLEPVVWDFIMNHHDIKKAFNFKCMKYVEKTATFHFLREFDDSKDAVEFEKKVKEFLNSFQKAEVKIPSAVFNKVNQAVESKRHEFKAGEIDVKFDCYRVILIGKKEQVIREQKSVENLIDKVSEEANRQPEKMEIEDKNKLKFLNFIGYFRKLSTQFPAVDISGMESGNLTLYGSSEKTKDVQLKILQDFSKIREIDVKTSDRQIDFLKGTECKMANDELKKDDVMLILISIEGAVGAKSLQAKLMTMKKRDDNEEKRLVDIALAKTSEKCIRIDADTAKFLPKSDKLQALIKEQFEKHQVMINPELTDPCNIWIVCEKSKMSKAQQDLASLADEKKITSSTFKPVDPMKIRFLKEHCWGKIMEKERSCKTEGVEVVKCDNDSFEIKGTKAGRQDIILFLEKLAGKVDVKTFPLNEPGVKKQMSMEVTNAIILEIEKDYKCVIEADIQPMVDLSISSRTIGQVACVQTTGGISFKIYSDDRGKIDKAWGDLKRKIKQNIAEKPVDGDVIKKFSDGELEKIRKLERDYDVKITPDISKGRVMVKGHITDIATIQEEIRKILKDFAENENKVPEYWDFTAETVFKKTASQFKIVRIERIQNNEIYALYKVKRQKMIQKYVSNFAGKELMLFHGTSAQNIEHINAGGLNRSFAGIYATNYGRGVYFTRDASHSCNQRYSPPDPLGFRYVYYAKVLVGEYTIGLHNMIVAPPKDPSNPSEAYESVVDNVVNPRIYVLFKDYEYYTEYLITFR